jgi:anti-anti-sigma factor
MTQAAQAPLEEQPDAEPFLTEVHYLEHTTLVAMSGDVLGRDVDELRRLVVGLVGGEQRTVVLDLARLRSMDPAAVEVVIAARRHLVGRGGDLVLRGPAPGFFRVLARWMREGTFDFADAPPIE